jgi:hypothetical protein
LAHQQGHALCSFREILLHTDCVELLASVRVLTSDLVGCVPLGDVVCWIEQLRLRA